MRSPLIFLFVTVLLTACGESPEEAYERGVEDGIDTVCSGIERYSDRIYDALSSERIC